MALHAFGQAGRLALTAAIVLTGLAVAGNADSVVPLTFNGFTINSDTGQPGWGGFGDFTYNGADTMQVSSLGPYGAFVYDSDAATGGALMNGSGAGWNSAVNSESPFDELTGHLFDITANDFPVLDRAGFGHNFNPDDYKIEVVYKPLPTNEAPVLNVQFDTHDGFVTETREGHPFIGTGQRSGEQHQWGFGYGEDANIQQLYDAGEKDADGFVTISTPLSDGMGGLGPDHTFSGPTFLFNSGDQTFQGLRTIEGEGEIDFGTFEDLAPNGVGQLHLQSAFTDDNEDIVGRLHLEVKRISIVPINPDPSLAARMDAMSGIGRRFGTPFTTQTNPDGSGAIDNVFLHEGDLVAIRPLDQLQRFDESGFTNLIIQTDDDDETGGFGIWQDHIYQTFDGTEATLAVRAKLTPLNPNAQEEVGRAPSFGIVLNDFDGDDSAEGLGGEEYRYEVQTADLSEDELTTLEVPLTDLTRQQAFEFVNPGDESLEDFNLYYMGVVTNQDAGLVGVEIEFIEVRLPTLGGDFNGDGVVDARDYTTWRDGLGTTFTAADYEEWRANYGGGTSAAAPSSAATAPEPTALALLAVAALAGVGCRRDG